VISVTFTAIDEIPSFGSISIEFLMTGTSSFLKIYPNCRSAIFAESLLLSEAGNDSGNISC